MLRLALAVLALACVAHAADDAAESTKSCFLLGGSKADKPFPSLTQCYKQNQQACCVSAHDETIAGAYGNILSGTCIREYEDLEQYYCLGCSPDADSFIDWYNATTTPSNLGTNFKDYVQYDGQRIDLITVEADAERLKGMSNALEMVPGKYGEIKLCESFANKLLYGQDATAPGASVDAYDGCGMMLDGFPSPEAYADNGYGGDGALGRQIFALGKDEVDATGNPLSLDAIYALSADKHTSPQVKHYPGFDDPAILAQQSGIKMSHAWKFFATLRPPYYGSDSFEISWHHIVDTGPNGPGCFGAASSVQVTSMAVALVAAVAHLLA